METLPPPGPGDNYYVICYNCGKLSYAKTSRADFCQHDDHGNRCFCNPDFHNRGKQPAYNPTITTFLGEEVNVDELIAIFYEEYARGGGEWGDTIAAAFLVMCCRYHGPLPTGTEIILVGGYVIRKVRIPHSTRVGYQFKPYTALTKDERDVRQSTLAKGVVTTFYKSERDHPLHESKMMAEEHDELERDNEDFDKRRKALERRRIN